jgi:alpha-L-rhamnosidase
MINPIGFEMEHVSVSWIAQSSESVKQAAARIIVAADPDMKNIICDLGPQQTDSVGTRLPVELVPCTRYY